MQIYQDKYLPENTRLAGVSYVLNELNIKAPLMEHTVISSKELQRPKTKDCWKIFGKKYWPGDDLFSHLTFSLKYEELNLFVLKKIFEKVNIQSLEETIKASPTSIYSRKIWFLFEYLTNKTLQINDLKSVTYIDLLDEKKYFTQPPIPSKRHKVGNNLLGIRGFSPIIRKTEKLLVLGSDNLKLHCEKVLNTVDKRLISRAASFLLLADTKATYEIEGERAPQNRLERWAKVVLEAGKHPLTIVELERLHRVLLHEDRFSKFGIRNEEVFLGDRDFDNNPIPEFIGCGKDNLAELMQLWLDTNKALKKTGLHPIIQASILAFSFIYIHPLQDGNGRLHRYLFHHILADRGFTPKGIVFPVSSVIFDHIERYKETLTNVSSPLMSFVDWEVDEKLNVRILNDTIDLYRFFNLTGNTEFLYDIVKETIEVSLPQELEQLKKYDKAKRELSSFIEMPDNQLSLLINVIKENGFKLSKGKRSKFFFGLKDEEVSQIESIIEEVYTV